MVWKDPVTSRRQARLCRSNGIWERAPHDKRTLARRRLVAARNGEVADLLVPCRGLVADLSRGGRRNGI